MRNLEGTILQILGEGKPLKGREIASILSQKHGINTYRYSEAVTTKTGRVDFIVFPSTTPGLIASYVWNPDRKSIYINVLTISHPETQSTYVATTSCPGQSEHTLTLTNKFASAFTFPLLPQTSQSFKLEIADNYNIRPGNINQSKNKPWSGCNGNGKIKITAHWDVVQPNKAPAAETPARVAN